MPTTASVVVTDYAFQDAAVDDRGRRHGQLRLSLRHPAPQRRVLHGPADVVHADRGRHLAAVAAAALVPAGAGLGGVVPVQRAGRLRVPLGAGLEHARVGDRRGAFADAVAVAVTDARHRLRAVSVSLAVAVAVTVAVTRRRRRRRGRSRRTTRRAPLKQLVAGRGEHRPGRQQRHGRRSARRSTSASRPARRASHNVDFPTAKPTSCVQTAGPVIGAGAAAADVRAAARAGPATARSTRPAPTRSCAPRTAPR